MREIIIGGAQLGAIQKSDSRASVVQRMLVLLEQARQQGCELVVFPELALTTFFPRWFMEDQQEVDAWFEREMPSELTRPLFDFSRDHGIAMSFGYAELTCEGQHFNTSILTDRQGNIVGKYRKVHLPGHVEFDTARDFQHLEKRYFEPGDLGFPTWETQGAVMGMCICNDRRWPETYRVMGLHHSELCMQAGAYQNATWVVGVAKAGVEDGFPLMGGSVIIDPNGFVVARAKGQSDELIVHACDMDLCNFGKSTIFDFARHRRIEHYGIITRQTGVQRP